MKKYEVAPHVVHSLTVSSDPCTSDNY